MQKIIISFVFIFLAHFLQAQQNVLLMIRKLPADHPKDSAIYIAGSFNGWNPRDERYKLNYGAHGYTIEFSLQKGNYEYKFTRGGWDKVECKKDGSPLENRVLKLENDLSLQLDIDEWQDRFPVKPKKSTASRSVQIMDTAFWLPQLQRQRRVWIYLPASYHNDQRRKYEVLYMHDGQNVFDDSTSFSGEWGLDEMLDSINREVIVVAIDHGNEKRMNEYNPYDHERFGKGEGKSYIDFLARTLKPYIDKHYRTKKKKKHTMIAGSSMGGLISMYAVLSYPKVFGGAGVFSPAFWVAPRIYDEINKKGKKVKSNIYFYAGKQEGERMVPDLLKAFETMGSVSKSHMRAVIKDEGRHNELAWRKELPAAFFFMLDGDQHNGH
ncbi:MAG TPA: alpha/beta hydrolase-fold protein [Chitinophagaceae bacterium]|nr:alpha/beta hydrolase-fold protein [Chitinophagaceae bacterium]